VPGEAQLQDVSSPDTVIGDGMNTRFLNNVCHDVGPDVGGGAIFFVSNDRSGSLVIEDSVLRGNPSDGFETQGYPGIFVLANGDPQVRNSVIE
jgi:hypothetical protein